MRQSKTSSPRQRQRQRRAKQQPWRRDLHVEQLEDRRLLSILGHPGALDGKLAYVNAGHGWVYDTRRQCEEGDFDLAWKTQRTEYNEIVEDFGNQDQMTLYADYLFRAGATVVPLRPIGHQTREVVLDNIGPVTGDGSARLAGGGTVEFVGNWTDSTSTVFFGPAGATPYRAVATSASRTAYAKYIPDIEESGLYPVYAWVRADATWRTSDQRYRIHYAGGQTEVSINHRDVGNGYVYLGTYFFEQGTTGYVEIGNQSTDLRSDA